MSEQSLLPKLTRRRFLQATAITATAVAVGDKLFGGPLTTLVEGAPPQATEDVWIRTSCFHCSAGCGIMGHRVNGVVVKIEGQPGHPTNEGRACARGNANIFRLYNPYRTKKPVKRTNPERARFNKDTNQWEIVDPKWVEISWDEALNTVADRLKKIRADNPNKFVQCDGWLIKENEAISQFPRAYGTINKITGFGGSQCGAAMHLQSFLLHQTSTVSTDDELLKFKIGTDLVGGSMNKSGVQEVRLFVESKERGVKNIVLEPRYSINAMKAGEWLPIRPGADSAVSLSMINVIMNELKVWDVDSLKKRTNAPYLVGADGNFVRAKEPLVDDPVRKTKYGPPLIWDPKDNKAKPWNDKTFKDYALEGEYDVDGVKAKPAFQVMKDHVKQFTPEWAEKISDIPAATIRRITQEFVDAAQIGSTITIDGAVMPYRPAIADVLGSRNHQNSSNERQAHAVLNLLVGNHGVPGGLLTSGDNVKITANPADGIVQPNDIAAYRFKWPPDAYQQDTFYPIAYKAWAFFWYQILDRKKFGTPYEVEALSVMGANPIMDGGSPDLIIEAMTKIPFIWTTSYHFDECTEMADIVFPEPGSTEKYCVLDDTLRQPLVDKPLYDTMQVEDILTEIADRAGFLKDYNTRINSRLSLKDDLSLDVNKKWKWVEIMDRYLKAKYGKNRGLEWFKTNGFADDPVSPKLKYDVYTSPDVRYPFYWEYTKWVGEQLKRDLDKVGVQHINPDVYRQYHALPTFEESTITQTPPEYDLWAINWKGNLMAMGMTADNAWLKEMMDKWQPDGMQAWIHPQTAAKYGIKSGDLIWVESGTTKSRVKIEALVTEGIHPKAIAIGGQFGRYSPDMNPFTREGAHYNRLASIDAKYTDALACGFDIQAKVKVYKV
ncbi:MAG TPA: molybdopterin-dependent oxidoreductase [Anaerolineae bacterium]